MAKIKSRHPWHGVRVSPMEQLAVMRVEFRPGDGQVHRPANRFREEERRMDPWWVRLPRRLWEGLRRVVALPKA